MRLLAPRLAVTVLAAVALTACSQSTSLRVPGTPTPEAEWSTPAAVPSLTETSTGTTREVSFTTMLMSTDKKTHSVGPEGQVLYGWNNLEGATTFEGKGGRTLLQGSVWYVGGSGPFNGFLTITLDDGSTLGLDVTGTAAKSPTTDVTDFKATLVVIGGSGAYANSTGGGELTGRRDGALGTAVRFDVDLELTS